MSKDVRTRICSRVERNILEISDHKSAQNTEATRRQSNWDSLMLTIVRNTSLSMKRFSFKLKLFSRIFQIFLVICSLFCLVMKIRLDTSLFFAERERKR